MKKQITLISLFILLALPLLMAETEIYKINEEVDLKFTCTLDDAIPSASTTYNITISYPNGDLFIDNNGTTARGNGAFNFTTNFTEIGLYKVQMFCIDGLESFSGEGYYEITGNGKEAPGSNVIVLFSIKPFSIKLPSMSEKCIACFPATLPSPSIILQFFIVTLS